jgi:hypothetical protein
LIGLSPAHDLHLVDNNRLLYNQMRALQLLVEIVILLMRLYQLLLCILLFLLLRVHLVWILMNDSWSLNNYWILYIRNRAIDNEVVDVIVGVDVCYVLTWGRRIVINLSFLFWRLVFVNYIFNFKIIFLLKVLIIVSTRTLIIKIDCARLGNFSIWLKVLSLRATLFNSLCR